MNEPKPFASLGPTLLARKGGARPAMRPQLAPLTGLSGAQAAQSVVEDLEEELEDLGWNDMGDDDDRPHEAHLLALTPAPANPLAEAAAREEDAAARAELAGHAPAEPEIRRQQLVLSTALEGGPRRERRGSAAAEGRRAAFTLRLDAKRHLKLRLASTVKNRSAQQLVTEALDKFLAGIPEIEALAAQVKRN
jgi:hypothetical protein